MMYYLREEPSEQLLMRLWMLIDQKELVLAILIDRGHRELPIRPDFIGRMYQLL